MSIKQVNADSPLTGFDLWPTAAMTTVSRRCSTTPLRWEPLTDYEFELEFVPGQFTITVSESDTVLESSRSMMTPMPTASSASIITPRVTFSTAASLAKQAARGRYSYDVDAIDPDTDPLRLQPDFRAAGHGDRSHQRSLSWFATEDSLGQQAVTVAVEDGRGGIDTQSYLLEVSNIPPGEIRGQVREEAILDSGSVQVTVPGTFESLASRPAVRSERGAGDLAPAQSPVFVEGLSLEGISSLLFTATGAVSFTPTLPGAGATADGETETGVIGHAGGAQNGIGNVIAPANGLIGVFLGDDPPNTTPAPTASLDFRPAGNCARWNQLHKSRPRAETALLHR